MYSRLATSLIVAAALLQFTSAAPCGRGAHRNTVSTRDVEQISESLEAREPINVEVAIEDLTAREPEFDQTPLEAREVLDLPEDLEARYYESQWELSARELDWLEELYNELD